MLARQQNTEDNAEVPPSRLKVVGERTLLAAGDAPVRRRRLPFVGNLIGWFREGMREQPERAARLLDRLILVLVIVVVIVSAYVLIADPS